MSETDPRPDDAVPRRRHFSMIWLIPIVAALVAGYLGYTTIVTRGPLISIDFQDAAGLAAGQTQVRYKAVVVGTVESIHLSEDLQRVTARVRMQRDVAHRLTEGARFWVVRPRLNAGAVSGLETIISGAYIEFEPGPVDAEERYHFSGLDDPPGIRSDQPGTIFALNAKRIGSLDQGSPIFFRDVAVGEILGYDPPGIDGNIVLRAFIREPYDRYVRAGSRFWNISGVGLSVGPNGVRLELESLRAVVAGGVAFDTPPRLRNEPAAPAGTSFALYDSLEAARSATSAERLQLLTYFTGSVRGLGRGSPVEMQGIRIGTVSDLRLEYDAVTESFRVPVHLHVEPGRISFPGGRPKLEALAGVQRMVERGLRAQLRSANLLTGQMVLALDFVPGAEPATARMEGEEIVIPSVGGDAENIMAAVSEVAGKLQRFPLDEIGKNLNGMLAATSGLVGGPEMRKAITALTATLTEVQGLVGRADKGLDPLLRRLPAIADNLDKAVSRASQAAGSIERGYGSDSSINRQLERLLVQAADTARSIRLLADYLDRHPEALVRGRTDRGTPP